MSRSVEISMGTNYVPFLAEQFLYSYEAEFFQTLVHYSSLFLSFHTKPLAVAFKTTFRYFNDVLSLNNNQFHSYVDSRYPDKIEIKDTIELFQVCCK
jgi:hypothetical protein